MAQNPTRPHPNTALAMGMTGTRDEHAWHSGTSVSRHMDEHGFHSRSMVLPARDTLTHSYGEHLTMRHLTARHLSFSMCACSPAPLIENPSAEERERVGCVGEVGDRKGERSTGLEGGHGGKAQYITVPSKIGTATLPPPGMEASILPFHDVPHIPAHYMHMWAQAQQAHILAFTHKQHYNMDMI